MSNKEHLDSIRKMANEAKAHYSKLDEAGKTAYREARRLKKNAEVLSRYHRNKAVILARMKARRDELKKQKEEAKGEEAD